MLFTILGIGLGATILGATIPVVTTSCSKHNNNPTVAKPVPSNAKIDIDRLEQAGKGNGIIYADGSYNPQIITNEDIVNIFKNANQNVMNPNFGSFNDTQITSKITSIDTENYEYLKADITINVINPNCDYKGTSTFNIKIYFINTPVDSKTDIKDINGNLSIGDVSQERLGEQLGGKIITNFHNHNQKNANFEEIEIFCKQVNPGADRNETATLELSASPTSKQYKGTSTITVSFKLIDAPMGEDFTIQYKIPEQKVNQDVRTIDFNNQGVEFSEKDAITFIPNDSRVSGIDFSEYVYTAVAYDAGYPDDVNKEFGTCNLTLTTAREFNEETHYYQTITTLKISKPNFFYNGDSVPRGVRVGFKNINEDRDMRELNVLYLNQIFKFAGTQVKDSGMENTTGFPTVKLLSSI